MGRRSSPMGAPTAGNPPCGTSAQRWPTRHRNEAVPPKVRPGRGSCPGWQILRVAPGSENSSRRARRKRPRVTVPRRHLELLPPDHTLAPEPDGEQAAWWLHQLDRWGADGIPVSAFVPASFPAVCQVLHPWFGSDGEPIRWQALAEHPGAAGLRERYPTRGAWYGRSRSSLACTARLGSWMRSPPPASSMYSAAPPRRRTLSSWRCEGWGDVPPQRFPGAARLNTQARDHFLLRGPLTGVLVSVAAFGVDRPTAGLWWAADRAWFVAAEIDLEWTFVAGDTDLVERLQQDPRREVIGTTFDAPANHAVQFSRCRN
jgi:hypothetical protein